MPGCAFLDAVTLPAVLMLTPVSCAKAASSFLAYKVTNSNPGIATVQNVREDNIVTLTIAATGNATGKTNITISSTDGSNKGTADLHTAVCRCTDTP